MLFHRLCFYEKVIDILHLIHILNKGDDVCGIWNRIGTSVGGS